jgi:DNA-binding MarR family transcriptional regulator
MGEYRALARFRRGLRAFLHFSEEAARAAGLTPAQHQLLLAVKGRDGGQAPSIGELADWLKLRHHSTVELIDRVVATGLAERRADPDDGRCQRIVLTPRGDEKLAGLSALHREELRRFREETLAHLESLAGGDGAGVGSGSRSGSG